MDTELSPFVQVDYTVETLLKNVAEKYGFRTFSIKSEAGSSKGDGFLGTVIAIELRDNDKVLNLVVKAAAKSINLRKDTAIADIFQRELYMYNTILPTLKNLEIKYNLPPMSCFAKYYDGSEVDKNEAIILENLKVKGFKLYPRHQTLNEQHTILVLSEFARFHALSLVLKDQNREQFYEVTKSLDDVFVKFFTKPVKILKNHCHRALKVFSPVEDVRAYTALKDFADNIEYYLASLPSFVDEYSVILHGDTKAPNIMFGYDDLSNSKMPTKLCFLDLQLARLGPLVFDIAYFLYASCSKDIITDFRRYLNIYYDNLAEYIRKLGSNPDELYPNSIFWKQWKESARYGLMLAAFIIKLLISEEHEVADFAEAADCGLDIVEAFDYDVDKADEYCDRLRHIVLHFVENQFL